MHLQRLAIPLGLLALVASFNAGAACLGRDAVEAARAFFEQHRYFHHDDPALIGGVVSPRLLGVLTTEYRCAQGEICALDADPWTAAQDGDIAEPIAFQAKSASATAAATAAAVTMSYTFTLGESGGTPQAITLRMERPGADACWVVADLLSPRGESLVDAIERWHATYGPAAAPGQPTPKP